MTLKEVESVYDRACHKRRLRPNQEEGQEWYRQLKGFERADVEQAVAEWDANGTLDLRGQPKSKWLPSAIELTNLTAAVAERRLKSATGPLDILYWQCEGPLLHRWVAYIGRSVDNRETGICSWCGAAAHVEKRSPDGE